MTETTSQLLSNVEALPAAERHALLVELFRRNRELVNDFVADQLVGLADELFQTLDREEANVHETNSR